MYSLNYCNCSRYIDYKAKIQHLTKLQANEEATDTTVSHSCCNYCNRMLKFEDNITNKNKSNDELQIEYFIKRRCPFNHQDKTATKISKLIDIISSEESPFTNVIKSAIKEHTETWLLCFKTVIKYQRQRKVKEIVNEYHLKVCEYPY